MVDPQEILKLVTQGQMSGLQGAVALKRLTDAVEQVKERVMDVAINEFYRDYGSKQAAHVDGARISAYAGRSTYKYDHIPEVDIAKTALQNAQERAKWALNYTQKHGGDTAPDPDTGEALVPAKVSYSKESISISLGV